MGEYSRGQFYRSGGLSGGNFKSRNISFDWKFMLVAFFLFCIIYFYNKITGLFTAYSDKLEEAEREQQRIHDTHDESAENYYSRILALNNWNKNNVDEYHFKPLYKSICKYLFDKTGKIISGFFFGYSVPDEIEAIDSLANLNRDEKLFLLWMFKTQNTSLFSTNYADFFEYVKSVNSIYFKTAVKNAYKEFNGLNLSGL